jgi:hypothetical protein
MITGRNTDARNPSKILRMPLAISGTTYEWQTFAHFRGVLVGVQLSQNAPDAGTYSITVTDVTKGTTLLSTGTFTPAGTPYLAEFYPTPVTFLPAPDSQLDQLPLINSGDTIKVVVTASAGTATDSVLTLEFQGS